MPDTNIATTIMGSAIQPSTRVGARKVDVHRGTLDGSVSSQWFARPDDQRFLDLESLLASVKGRRELSVANTFSTRAIKVRGDVDDQTSLQLLTDQGIMVPNHWSFGQICQRVQAPAAFLRQLRLAPHVLQERLAFSEAEEVKILRTINLDGSPAEMRAVTGPDYGRVWDEECVEAVMKVASDGTWKVPGVINWSNGSYDPDAAVSKQSTTLYASDRDVFMFLCRDQYPIDIGKLANGDPDLMFPGFIVSNSEVGKSALKIETMYLRAVCMNRNLWGVENKQSLSMRHSKGLPSRFAASAMPALRDFSNISASAVAKKVIEAKRISVGNNDDEVSEWLMRRNFTKKTASEVLASVSTEEGHKARSLWDIVNGLTATARSINFQDERVELERKAGALMDKVTT